MENQPVATVPTSQCKLDNGSSIALDALVVMVCQGLNNEKTTINQQ